MNYKGIYGERIRKRKINSLQAFIITCILGLLTGLIAGAYILVSIAS